MKRVFLSFIIIAALLCVSACAPDMQRRQPDMLDSIATSDTAPPIEQKSVGNEEPSTSLEDIEDNEPETSRSTSDNG